MFCLLGSATFAQNYPSGELVVKFSQSQAISEGAVESGLPALDAVLQGYEVEKWEPMFPFVKVGKRPGAAELKKVYRLYYRAERDPMSLGQRLGQRPEIEYAEPFFWYEITEVPNDTFYTDEKLIHQQRIMAPEAWDIVKGDTGNVVIAIVDGGTQWQHPDLIDNVWTNPNEIPNNGIDDDNNGFIDDVHGWDFPADEADPTGDPLLFRNAGHGTHVAGTAAARTDNEIGVSSISWNARFMPINASHIDFDRAIQYSAQGILYAALMGADIINCSFGGRSYSDLTAEIIRFATANGSLVVAAAGNDFFNNDLRPFYPAMYPDVLSVGASSRVNDTLSSFTNYGISMDVYAPGSIIWSTTSNNGYEFRSGTSMATPNTCALAALVKTRFPQLGPVEIAERIRMSCDDIRSANVPYGDSIVQGRINAFRAVSAPSSPSVRLREVRFQESGGDGVIHPGDTVDLSLRLRNYLEDAGALYFLLRTNDSALTLLDSLATLPGLIAEAEAEIRFRYVIADTAGQSRLPFFLHLTDSANYRDAEFFAQNAEIDNPVYLTHRTDSIRLSITQDGNLGFVDQLGSAGEGWEYAGKNRLFEAGLILSNGPDQVINTVSGVVPGLQQSPLYPVGPITMDSLSIVYELGTVVLEDSTDVLGARIQVEQLSLAGFPENPNLDNSVMLVYEITNLSPSPIPNLRLGLYIDGDLPGGEYGAVDTEDEWVRLQNQPINPDRILGLKFLNDEMLPQLSILSQPQIADGFSDLEAWSALKGDAAILPDTMGALASMISVGPVELRGYDQLVVGFLLTAAASDTQLVKNGVEGERLFSRYFRPKNPGPRVDIEPDLPDWSQPFRVFPNPFSEQIKLSWELPARTELAFRILDAQGRLVARWDPQVFGAGTHQISWEGKALPQGLYHWQIIHPEGSLAIPFLKR